MASIYSCKECGSNLNLQTIHLYPPDFYFEAGNKGTLSFSAIHFSKFNLEKESNILPFFETVNHWGIHRNRTKMNCSSCGYNVGYVYYDGPPLTKNSGPAGQAVVVDPSQLIPRAPRFRCKIKSFNRFLRDDVNEHQNFDCVVLQTGNATATTDSDTKYFHIMTLKRLWCKRNCVVYLC